MLSGYMKSFLLQVPHRDVQSNHRLVVTKMFDIYCKLSKCPYIYLFILKPIFFFFTKKVRMSYTYLV